MIILRITRALRRSIFTEARWVIGIFQKNCGTAKRSGWLFSTDAEVPRQAGPDFVDILIVNSRNANPEVERETLLFSPDHPCKRGIRSRSVVGSLGEQVHNGPNRPQESSKPFSGRIFSGRSRESGQACDRGCLVGGKACFVPGFELIYISRRHPNNEPV